jgi:hypothetical protein
MPYYKFICVIIDAYSTGKYLAPILAAQGYPCIHIKSSSFLPSRFQHNENNFIENFIYENNIEYILSCLKPYKVKFCIPGYESGVELADVLNEKLGLSGNKSEFSIRKRNKYLMNEAVTAASIPTVNHYYSDTLPSLINWIKTINSYPVVAKPLDSANGDGVHFCNTDEQLQIAFQHITSSHNQFGAQNKEVLIEALNIGDEYIINTVSYEKRHFIAEIWKVTRKGLTTIYDKAEILSGNENEWDILGQYTYKVLDALGIEYGAATTEVKYTPERGAVLLETSGRLMGNSPLGLSFELAGFTQLSLLIESYLSPYDFLSRFERPRFRPALNAMTVVLISNCEGVINKQIGNAFTNLETLHSYNINEEIGSAIFKTVDSLTSPGELYLLGSKEKLEEDYSKIRLIEEKLYHEITKESSLVFSLFPSIEEAAIPKLSKKEESKLEAEQSLS